MFLGDWGKFKVCYVWMGDGYWVLQIGDWLGMVDGGVGTGRCGAPSRLEGRAVVDGRVSWGARKASKVEVRCTGGPPTRYHLGCEALRCDAPGECVAPAA